ncbi:hypothetical protein [Microvirga arabica]|uniref:Uncharacterized protein n=1 Tax=Microvirga arabica TaxID=1128671 RepID=A0ABV6Y564_9HYPH|nr:hypothetical protein [Microvirga arabica]MBM1175427.1 hypothetical protein [Microvirga arabica]
MGAAATGSVPHNRARKEGKRYRWGAERPSVLERRVQFRKKQIDAEIAQIKAEGEKEIARKVAAKEAERLKVLDQEVLLAEHREDVRKRRTFRETSSYIVPKGTFTDEQLVEFMASNPGLSEKEARVLLSMRTQQEEQTDLSRPDPMPSQDGDATAPSSMTGSSPDGEPKAKPVEAAKAVREKSKPAPIHIAASVTISSPTDDDEVRSKGTDWSDFDPDKWVEGQDYPEDRYREITDRDGNRVLVARTDEEDLSETEVSPEVQALWDREEQLSKEQQELTAHHGQIRMNWPQSALDRMEALRRQKIAIGIQLEKLLEG